jgi:hypothetical protein
MACCAHKEDNTARRWHLRHERMQRVEQATAGPKNKGRISPAASEKSIDGARRAQNARSLKNRNRNAEAIGIAQMHGVTETWLQAM